MKEKLGKAEKPDLHIEDHGILTLMIGINFGGSHQGFGGYKLDGHAAGIDFIKRILDLFGVNRLEEVTGKPIYALYDHDGWNATIVGLRTPPFDGSREFLISDWQRDHGFGK